MTKNTLFRLRLKSYQNGEGEPKMDSITTWVADRAMPAIRMPRPAPAAHSISDSARTCCINTNRGAPSALRMATSLIFSLALAMSTLLMLKHPRNMIAIDVAISRNFIENAFCTKR